MAIRNDESPQGREPLVPPARTSAEPLGGLEPMLAAGAAGIDGLAREAARWMRRPGPSPDRLVAALAAILTAEPGTPTTRIRAADALARLGPAAAEAIPLLSGLLPSAVAAARPYASMEATAPSLARAVIGALGAAGPAAESAVVPLLAGLVDDEAGNSTRCTRKATSAADSPCTPGPQGHLSARRLGGRPYPPPCRPELPIGALTGRPRREG